MICYTAVPALFERLCCMVAIRVRKKNKPPGKASEWIKRKLQVNDFQESSDHIGTPYLVNQDKPVLCNEQLPTIVHLCSCKWLSRENKHGGRDA